jgi:Contractile injection system tube protein/LysM domain
MTLQRAIIEIDPRDAKGFSDRGRLPTSFEVQFNPQTLRFSKGSQIAEIAIYGLDSPLLQYVRGQTETLTVELFFDSTEGGMGEGASDVRGNPDLFYALVKQQSELHAPPRVIFRWGRAFAFKGVVERFERGFELFAPDGTPLRATISLTLKEFRTLEEQIKAVNPRSPDRTRSVVVRQGDTLHGLAAGFYDEPRAWRAIAARNRIEDPLRPPVGTVIELPAMSAAEIEAVEP